MMMKKVLKNDTLKMLQFSGLSGHCNISHFITTRHGGVSQGNYASMNPSEYSGDNNDFTQVNRKILTDAIGISPRCLFTPFQTHEDQVACLDSSFLSLNEESQKACLYGVDALITAASGVCVAVSTADCVPILLYAADKGVVAAVHAGWRGTVRQIAMKAVRAMVEKYACDPSLICAGIGPSISQEAFEVGEEVVDAFRTIGADLPKILFRHPETGKAHIDLWEANRMQLQEAGLDASNIEVSGICTYSQPEEFFSARRLGIQSGRILSGILINK